MHSFVIITYDNVIVSFSSLTISLWVNDLLHHHQERNSLFLMWEQHLNRSPERKSILPLLLLSFICLPDFVSWFITGIIVCCILCLIFYSTTTTTSTKDNMIHLQQQTLLQQIPSHCKKHRPVSGMKHPFLFKQIMRRIHSSSLTLTCILIEIFFLIQVISISSIEAATSSSWQDNIQAKIRVSRLPEGDYQKFTGNSSHEDHFKLLQQDGESLLVGARNIIYNISLSSLEENRRLEWFSPDEDVKLCRLKGKSEDDCHNYVRVMAKKSEDTLLVCGTNSFKPRCREYLLHSNTGEFEVLKESSGEGLCPYDPHHNSTAIFANDNLYVATVAQFSGADPLIYGSGLRTEQFNPKHLNQPNFVNSLQSEDHVYFFFRETAVEYINCGKKIYSRVARVCTKDKGGPHKFRAHWTSFVKARLNCSIPGDFPFYFDEIQSTSNFVKGTYNGRSHQMVYGIFTTPVNSLGASAVCAFKMDDIKAAFDGQFKGQEDSNSNWLPVANSKVPDPRPGKCVNDSRQLPETTLNFIKDHTLMDQSVNNFWGHPLFVQSSFKFRFTQIAVDPQIETVSGKTYDVLFIGTDDGRVLKVINAAAAAPSGHHLHNKVMPVIIEETTVFPNKLAISNLLVYHTFYEAKLLVVSSSEIQAIPLHKCQARASTCGSCVQLQDPYCAWDVSRQVCTSSRSRFWNRDNFVQNIEDGWDNRCPDGRPRASSDKTLPVSPSTENEIPNSISAKPVGDALGGSDVDIRPPPSFYSAETFALAVVTSIVTSFVIGFILGYIFSRRCRKDNPGHHGYYHPGHQSALGFNPYADPTGYTDFQLHHPVQHSDHYATQLSLSQGNNTGIPGRDPIGVGLVTGNTGTLITSHQHVSNSSNNKPINLVLNVPTTNKNGKNANSSADNKPMMQKVKKIYL